LAFALIVIFGIPHGATDHVLHNLLKEGKINKVPQAGFLLFYLGVITAYGILWYLFPALSLLLFLAISAFHFGETQLVEIETITWHKYLSWIAWGSLALLLIFYPHLDEVGQLIAPWLISESIMKTITDAYPILLGLNSLILVITLIPLGFNILYLQITEMLILLALSWFSSLLLSFAIFFAFWHSRDAMALQLKKISFRISGFNLKQWISLALPYTAVSLFGIASIVLIFNFSSIDFPLVTLFFILVALITLPHVFVMTRFYRA
jgi:Brp/Blh family beta-carotene 15,15'-monooxygenase